VSPWLRLQWPVHSPSPIRRQGGPAESTFPQLVSTPEPLAQDELHLHHWSSNPAHFGCRAEDSTDGWCRSATARAPMTRRKSCGTDSLVAYRSNALTNPSADWFRKPHRCLIPKPSDQTTRSDSTTKGCSRRCAKPQRSPPETCWPARQGSGAKPYLHLFVGKCRWGWPNPCADQSTSGRWWGLRC
jgi:hypothetical protein